MIRKLVTGSLMRKLVACFVLVSAAQIPIVGYLSFDSAKAGLEQAAFNKLDSERELQEERVVGLLPRHGPESKIHGSDTRYAVGCRNPPIIP